LFFLESMQILVASLFDSLRKYGIDRASYGILDVMDRRKKFLVALWSAFGLFWAFVAEHTAINPVLEPDHGPPIILILQIGMVVLCGLVVVRVIYSRNAQGP
jgi:hypothetical protein